MRVRRGTISGINGPGCESNPGTQLKELRRTQALTLAEVSQATGVSISNLSKIENNQISPSFDIMKRICDGFGLGIEDFMHPGAKSLVSGARPPRATMKAIISPAVI